MGTCPGGCNKPKQNEVVKNTSTVIKKTYQSTLLPKNVTIKKKT